MVNSPGSLVDVMLNGYIGYMVEESDIPLKRLLLYFDLWGLVSEDTMADGTATTSKTDRPNSGTMLEW